MDRRQFVVGSAATAAALSAGAAQAQDAYPTRPITLINPFPPGGAADVVGRPFAAVLARYQAAGGDREPRRALPAAVGAQFARAPSRTAIRFWSTSFSISGLPRWTSCSAASEVHPGRFHSDRPASPKARW